MSFIRLYWKQVLTIGAVLIIFFLAWGLDPETPIEKQQRFTIEKQQNLENTKEGQVNFDNLEIIEQIEQQNLGDVYFAETGKQMEEAYPWFSKLPIKTNQYTIVYDYELQKFRIKLKVGVDQSTAVTDALNKLRDIGVIPTANNYYVK